MITFKKTFFALTLLASVAPCAAQEAQLKQEKKITDSDQIKSDLKDKALCYAETLTVLSVGTSFTILELEMERLFRNLEAEKTN